MLDQFKKQSSLLTLALILFIAALSIYLFQTLWYVLGFFSDLIVIVVVSWVLSFILGPFAQKLSKYTRLPLSIAAGIVFLIFFGILIVAIVSFIPVVSVQIQTLQKLLPTYQSSFPQYVNQVTNTFVRIVNNSFAYIPSLAQVVADIVLILIFSFYLVLDKDRITRELYSLLPKSWHKHAQYVQELVDSTFASFIRVQILFGIVAGIGTWLIMTIFGINFAASTSLISGILTVIPLIGGLLALIPPVAIAFFIDPTKALLVLLFLLAMQQIIFNVIFPKVIGNALKLHPIIVLLSFLIGFKVAGSFGVIFAVPFFGVIFVLAHRLAHHFFEEK